MGWQTGLADRAYQCNLPKALSCLSASATNSSQVPQVIAEHRISKVQRG